MIDPHDAFDPNFKFPPIEKPDESFEQTVRRIDTAVGLATEPCVHCGALPMINSWNDDLPRTVAHHHTLACPQHAD